MIRDSAVPKHEQLRGILAELATRTLAPGDPFPSERQLCLDHQVSRITVRAAIAQLERDGLLERVRGKGTFVAVRTARSQLHLASFHQDMSRLGLTPSTEVLEVEHAVPPPDTVATLGLRASQKCYRVRRLRLADGVPMSVDDAWYHGARVPDLDRRDLTGSIYTLLREEYGLPINRAEQTVAAREADRLYARLLGVAAGTPILFFNRTAYSDDVAVEHTISRYRCDRYEVHMVLDG